MSQNREFIESLYDAFARGDAGTVLGALAPDVRWYEAEGNPYADGNPYDSPQRVGQEVFGRLLTDYEGYAVHPEQLVAEGNLVVALGRYTGTHRATSQPYDAQFVHVWTIVDGKVARFQQYTDTAQLQRHVTATHSPAQGMLADL
jgi:uncharacterized protein